MLDELKKKKIEEELNKYKHQQATIKDEEAIRWLLNDERGRWILSKLVDESFINEPVTFLDTNAILIREGRKALVLDLFRQIRLMGRNERLLLVKADAERQIWREDTKDSFFRKESK